MKLAALLVFLDVLAWTLFAESPFGKQVFEHHVFLAFVGWMTSANAIIILCLVADGQGEAVRAFFRPRRRQRQRTRP